MLLGVLPPSYKTLLRFIPDPFFVNGLKSWNGLEDFGRRTVKDRLDSPRRRDDILGRLLAVHSPDGTALTAERLDNLMAETITLL
jgi:cytochrome P450